MSVWLIAGTRPEIVKLAPVYFALRPRMDVRWIATGQHTDLARLTLKTFDIVPDIELGFEAGPSGLGAALGAMLQKLDGALADASPDLVVVQGDTSSALAGCLAAFARQIPVGHVEAGLRTFDRENPYPEEAWRVLIAQLATLQFAPTTRAAGNLIASGVPHEQVAVTGNTVVDAVRWLNARLPARPDVSPKRNILVTMHRRENWQGPLERVAAAINRIEEEFDDVAIEFVSHANPTLAARVRALVRQSGKVTILPPLSYEEFLGRIRCATLVLSDSGGVQEEAPEFGVPVLILRDTTERPECVECGVARLVGTETQSVVAAVRELLTDPEAYRRMAKPAQPFGDGKAAGRIADLIERHLARNSLPMARTG